MCLQINSATLANLVVLEITRRALKWKFNLLKSSILITQELQHNLRSTTQNFTVTNLAVTQNSKKELGKSKHIKTSISITRIIKYETELTHFHLGKIWKELQKCKQRTPTESSRLYETIPTQNGVLTPKNCLYLVQDQDKSHDFEFFPENLDLWFA